MSKQKQPRIRAGDVEWNAVRQHFLTMNLDPTRDSRYTLQETAEAFGLAYGTVRNKAAQDDWTVELATRLKDAADSAVTQAVEHVAEVEADIRNRQARIARKLYERAEKTLDDLGDEFKLDPTNIERWIKTGMIQEREALGIGKEFEQINTLEDTDWEPPLKKIERERDTGVLAEQLIEFLDEDG